MADPVNLVTFNGPEWLLAVLAAGLVAVAGMSARALTASGALAAFLVGSLLVNAGGWWTGVLIVAFFVSSSALSHYHGGYPAYLFAAKGGQRDAEQVLANGGVPLLFAIGSALATDPAPWLIAAAGAIAGACADTWATEIGKTSERLPRMITTWRHSPPGSSGAISTLGTLGALGGAAAIGLTASIGILGGWWPPDVPASLVLAIVTSAGFAGALVDSVLGATIQAQYRCPRCDVLTEQSVHACGVSTALWRGSPFVTNDLVNTLAIAVAGAMAGAGIQLVPW